MSVSDWSSTADENTSIDGINIAEHCPAKNMNDALRAMMAALKNKCDTLDDTDNTLRRGAVIGEIRWFAMSTPPERWLVCNGASVSTSDYAALFAAIGKTFTPRLTSTDPDVENPEYSHPTVFLLPNLMGKVPWGTSSHHVNSDMENGVFRWSTHGGGVDNINSSQTTGSGNLRFNANWSNPIYGKSGTVQPPALCLLPCIRYE